MLKYLRYFDNQQDFNTAYNGTLGWETTHIGIGNNISYHAYVGQSGNRYEWEGGYFTAVRNPLSGEAVYMSSTGNEVYGYVESPMTNIVRGAGYVEPWVGCFNSKSWLNKDRTYDGGTILDLRNPAHNPNMVLCGWYGNTDYSSHDAASKYRFFKLNDTVVNMLQASNCPLQYVITDWEDISAYDKTWKGDVKIIRMSRSGNENDGYSYYSEYIDWSPYSLTIYGDGMLEVYFHD